MIRFRSTALVTLALMLGASAQGAEGDKLERTVLAMGTTLRFTLSGPSQGDIEAASERAIAEVARIEAALSTWRPDSLFSRVNHGQGKEMILDPEWLNLLEAVTQLAQKTGGAFDPVLGALVQAWGLRTGGRKPTSGELAQARSASGIRSLRLDLERSSVSLLKPLAQLEEGGFGKGYALDRLIELLREAGMEAGLLDFGGQLAAFGRPVRVAIADPQNRQRERLSLALQNASLSTSGTSERGRHLLDPRTGRPCPAWGSVSVIATSALEADALSTALYVLGPRRGLRWATEHNLPACFLPNRGPIRMSPAFKALAPLIP